MPAVHPLKPGFPFRLGCTSYVYPDALLPNALALAPRFDDIELVLFESGEGNIPSPEEIDRLAALSAQYQNTYTVHFPIDHKACADEAAGRALFLESVAAIVSRLKALDPFAWILHLEGSKGVGEEGMKSWDARAREVCARVAALPGIRPERIALENLGYPFDWNLPLIREFGFSACLDTGHTLKSGQSPDRAFDLLLPHARVIHLHGFSEGRDHVSLSLHDREGLRAIIRRLRRYGNVVTLELFSESETLGSRSLLEELWKE